MPGPWRPPDLDLPQRRKRNRIFLKRLRKKSCASAITWNDSHVDDAACVGTICHTGTARCAKGAGYQCGIVENRALRAYVPCGQGATGRDILSQSLAPLRRVARRELLQALMQPLPSPTVTPSHDCCEYILKDFPLICLATLSRLEPPRITCSWPPGQQIPEMIDITRSRDHELITILRVHVTRNPFVFHTRVPLSSSPQFSLVTVTVTEG